MEIYEMAVVNVKVEWIMCSHSVLFICSDIWKTERERTFKGGFDPMPLRHYLAVT